MSAHDCWVVVVLHYCWVVVAAAKALWDMGREGQPIEEDIEEEPSPTVVGIANMARELPIWPSRGISRGITTIVGYIVGVLATTTTCPDPIVVVVA